MKRIEALNGYTIYEHTKRDERDGLNAGEYSIYFSSDIRDFGREYSTPEFESVGTLAEAEELCNNNYAIARELCEEETTAVSFEEIEEKQKELDARENKPEESTLTPCALVRFSTKSGKVDTTMTANGAALLKLWALRSTNPSKTTVIFRTTDGEIIMTVTGNKNNFPKVTKNKDGANIRNMAPGLLETLHN